jgi:hypothetical protein
MLMDEEQLHFMEEKRISQSVDEDLHHILVHIRIVQVPHVYMESNFHCIILDRDLEQLYELLMRNLFKVQPQKVVHVIILSVHVQNKVNVFSTYQKSLSVILCNS